MTTAPNDMSRAFNCEPAPVNVAGAMGTVLEPSVWTGGAATVDEAAGGAPNGLSEPESPEGGGPGGLGGPGGPGGGDGGPVAAGGAGGGAGGLTKGILPAFSMYFSMVLGLSLGGLMTIAIPRWQWLV